MLVAARPGATKPAQPGKTSDPLERQRTTHTVAAFVDRGNYPVASFDVVDAWPSIVAGNAAGELRFGLDAAAVRHEPGWSVIRSFKRLLNNAGPQTEVAVHHHRQARIRSGL